MSLRKPMLGFVLRVGVAYGLLTAAWFVVASGYGVVFRSVSGAVFGSFGREGVVRFQPHPRPEGEKETAMVLSRRGARRGVVVILSSRYVGYSPASLVVALILGTPLAWRRRVFALCWGLVLVNLYVLLRVLIGLLIEFGTRESIRLYELSPFWHSMLDYANEVFCLSVTAMYVVGILIWMAVCFRRDELKRIIETVQSR